MHGIADKFCVFNNKNMTPHEVASFVEGDCYFIEHSGGRRKTVTNPQDITEKWKRARRKEREERKIERQNKKDERKMQNEKDKAEVRGRMAETHMLVATLIATITFAAAFTIPGGYNGNQGPESGMAVLVRKAAFKAFLITNTIAVVCSVSSVFLYISASLFHGDDKRKKRDRRYLKALVLILVAIIAMMLAFITAAFAVLAHSVALAVVTCTVACIPFGICFLELRKIYREANFPSRSQFRTA